VGQLQFLRRGGSTDEGRASKVYVGGLVSGIAVAIVGEDDDALEFGLVEGGVAEVVLHRLTIHIFASEYK
jgi:hypothetical protein